MSGAQGSSHADEHGDHAGGLGAVIAGACLALTAYGALVIIASLLGTELVPHSNGATGLLMAGVLVVGAGIGAGSGALTGRSARP